MHAFAAAKKDAMCCSPPSTVPQPVPFILLPMFLLLLLAALAATAAGEFSHITVTQGNGNKRTYGCQAGEDRQFP